MTLVPQSTAFDVYVMYTNFLRDENRGDSAERMLKSGLIRFLIPAIGGPSPKGIRATADEVYAGLEYLKNLPPQKVRDFPEIMQEAFDAKDLDKETQRRLRSYIKQFTDWVVKRGYCEEVKRKQKFEFKRLHAEPGRARRDWHGQNGSRSIHGRAKKAVYRLGSKRFPEDYINSELERELRDYEEFRRYSCNCTPATITKEFDKLYQILGWLHRYKGVPLADLRLVNYLKAKVEVKREAQENNIAMVTFSPLNVTLDECDHDLNSYFLKKLILKETAIERANQDLNLVKDFMEFYGNHPRSRIAYLDVFLPVARFAYQNEIGTDDYPSDRDIPVIRKLKELKNKIADEAENTPPTVPFESKSVFWEEAVMVVEKLRLRAERELQYSMTKRNGLQTRNRTHYALERDLQDFLSVAFMVLMPPDRSRTYCELEIGRTMVCGLVKGKSKEDIVLPDQLKNASITNWYFHLERPDYKTGKKYGTYWSLIPNVCFPDGKTLYDYIDRWLSWGREHRQELEHNFFFRGCKSFKPLDTGDWRSRITGLFDREAGVPVSPKELRAMFVTYLNNIEATDAEKDAAARAMHHSRKAQSKYYDKQEQMKKIAPAFRICEQVTQKVFSEFSKSTTDN